jgi:SRSO17 transposase
MKREECVERTFSEEEEAEARRWSEGLEAVACRLDRHFARSEGRQYVRNYLRGLLSPAERKNSWQLAEAVGDGTPYGIQHLLGGAVWSADQVRDDLLCYVCEQLADKEKGILVIDETGFLKKGDKSVGVARQYSGTAGRVENCQIGVFAAYVSPGHAGARTLVDRALYLLKGWTDAPERCRAAGVPEEVRFATKPQLARAMVERVLEAGLPCTWVVADSVYGSDSAFRRWLEERHQPYVLGITSQFRLFDGESREWVKTIVRRLPSKEWKKRSCGAGTKGDRVYRWACRLICQGEKDFCRWLLARRSVETSEEMAYFIVSGPKATTLEEMVRVVGARWAIEECFEVAKSELGLDQYEVRSWAGWHRHVTLVMWLQALLSVFRVEAQPVSQTASSRRKKGAESRVVAATLNLN